MPTFPTPVCCGTTYHVYGMPVRGDCPLVRLWTGDSVVEIRVGYDDVVPQRLER